MKRRNKIKELERAIESLRWDITYLKLSVNSPPAHKVGDTVENKVVTLVYMKQNELPHGGTENFWVYAYTNIEDGTTGAATTEGLRI